MSTDLLISASRVTKVYRIWNTPASRLLVPLLNGLARATAEGSTARRFYEKRTHRHYRDFCALKDVSFELRRGESIGIIGRNGSGKSTLLQIVAGTTQPTSGTANVRGKIGALLELGSGFNPEFTGRENVELACALLGLSRSDTAQIYNSILEFADIGSYVDQPIKTYSSGMVVRLAFAVQTALRPDVLIVDEALSVGDEAFQRKCFARIEELKAGGTALLFVSHSAAQIVELCDRAILLSDGEVMHAGTPKAVVNEYHQLIYGGKPVPGKKPVPAPVQARQTQEAWALSVENSAQSDDDSFWAEENASSSAFVYPDAGAIIVGPTISNKRGARINHLRRGHAYHYLYEVTFSQDLAGVRFGASIKTLSGIEIGGMASHPGDARISRVKAGSRYKVRFTLRCDLVPGVYFLNAGALALDGGGNEYFAHRIVDACMFRVLYEPHLPVNALVDFLVRAETMELTADVVECRK